MAEMSAQDVASMVEDGTPEQQWAEHNKKCMRILRASFREGLQDEVKRALQLRLMTEEVMDESVGFVTTSFYRRGGRSGR